MLPSGNGALHGGPRWRRVSARSWSSFYTTGLTITPSVAGARLDFESDGTPVEVRLPARPKKTAAGTWENTDKISCHSWRTKSGRAINFTVHRFDVIVDVAKSVSVPVEAFEKIDARLFPGPDRERLDRIAQEGHAIARRAVERFLRVLRWKCLMGHIGHTDSQVTGSEWAPRLIEGQTGKHFFSTGHTITVRGSFGRDSVGPTKWRATETALRQKLDSPVWLDFLFAGWHRVGRGDLDAGILCLAIAVESIIRVLLIRHLRHPANHKMVDMLDRITIRSVLDSWKDLGYWTPAWQAATDLPKIKRLFDLRNGIMHRGDRENLTQAECSSLAAAVRAFVLHASTTAERLGR